MTNATTIPIINLGDSDDDIISTLGRTLSDTGFVMVQGHGISEALLANLRQLLATYFAQPLETKMQDCITPDNYRGYIPLGFFSPNAEGDASDHYEGYKLHFETASHDPIRRQCDLYGTNKWPAEPIELRQVIEAFWQACDATGKRLLSLLARIMQVEESSFISQFNKPLTNMTLLHYPPQPKNRDGFGIHPHKDTDALTLLFPDKVGGLWLQPRGHSEWTEVTAPSNTMVVNIGDLMELWSGGYFVSTPHKVVNTSGKERYSFPFFMVPRHDVVIAPLVRCQPGFEREPVPVGPVSREVWRTNWLEARPEDTGYDLGTLNDS